MSRGLAVRLALHGCTNRPFYHIIVMDKRRARNSKPMEQLGTYDPLPNKHNQILVAFNFERLKYWIAKGAVPTKHVDQLLGLSGFYPLHPLTYLTAKRKRDATLKAQQEAEETKLSEGAESSPNTDRAEAAS